MPSDASSDNQQREIAGLMGLGGDALVVPCRVNFIQSGFVALSEAVLKLAAMRPDGSLSGRTLDKGQGVVVFPSAFGDAATALNLVAEGELLRLDGLDRDMLQALVSRMETVEGYRVMRRRAWDAQPEAGEPDQDGAAPILEQAGEAEAGPGLDAGAVDQLTEAPAVFEMSPTTEEGGDAVPWYASVQGPAVGAFFPGQEDAGKGGTAPASQEGVGAEAKQPETDGVGYWRGRLASSPEAVKPYRQLFDLFYEQQDMERAFWHAAVLTHFQVARPLEQEVFDRYRCSTPIRPTRTIDSAMWAEMLQDPLQQPWPSEFFRVLARPLVIMSGRSLRSYGLKRKDRCDTHDSQILVARVFERVVETLGLEGVELYLASEAGFELAVANVVHKGHWVPCCVAGSGLLSGRSEMELTFILSRDLTYLRPEYSVGLVVPELDRQTQIMLAATRLVRPSLVTSDNMESVDALAKSLSKALTKDELAQVEDLVNRMVDQQVAVRLGQWNQSVQFTSHRIGLLSCQDLGTAAKLALMDPLRAGGATPEDRIRHLLRFAVDESHFRARSILGLDIHT